MAIQLRCGPCRGLLMVENTGMVVVCPHCSAELFIPQTGDDSVTVADSQSSEPPVVHPPESAAGPGEGAPDGDEHDSGGSFSFLDDRSVEETVIEDVDLSDPRVSLPPGIPPGAVSSKKSRSADSVTNAKDDTMQETDFVFLDAPTERTSGQFSAVEDIPTVSESPPPQRVASTVRKKPRRSPTKDLNQPVAPVPQNAASAEVVTKRKFLMLLGYAVAATVALFYLLFTRGQHALESLPDLEPQLTSEYRHVPEDADLPPQHDLKLGEARQFGSVIVRPLKVTRELLEFTHFDNEKLTPRAAEGPALKLWLEFEHTGQCGAFAPWDLNLMTKRAERANDPGELLSNTFLCRTQDLKTRDNLVLNYFHSSDSEWNLKDQHAGHRLAEKNQKLVTYVVCDPYTYGAVVNDAQSLVWRIQIRKGLGSSGNGVTTLVDVHFNPSDIAG